MSESVFDRLLNWIDANSETAPFSYEKIRRKLIIFFEGRQCGCRADELADRVFDIVTQKLNAGEQLASPSPSAYLYGVARNVLREQWKQPAAEPLASNELASKTGEADSLSRREQRKVKDVWDQNRRQQEVEANEQSLLSCLDQCLAQLPPETRKLILEYYCEEKRARIVRRQWLASSLNLTPNSLAIRVHRIRAELESRISRCLERDIHR